MAQSQGQHTLWGNKKQDVQKKHFTLQDMLGLLLGPVAVHLALASSDL